MFSFIFFNGLKTNAQEERASESVSGDEKFQKGSAKR